jgi:hypothetical protein
MHQSHSLDFKLVQRVCLLQQALDQALGSLDELKAQVQDKQWIETQLASTEQYANVQQQAIAHLKHQLAQFTEVQHHLLSVMGYRLNKLIDQQQQQFKHLHLHCHESQAELQTYLQYISRQGAYPLRADSKSPEAYSLALEAEVMVARSMAIHLSKHLNLAQQHLSHLQTELGNHHLNVNHIIQTIQAMIENLRHFDGAESLTQSQVVADGALVESSLAVAETPPTMPETDPEQLQATVRRQQLQIHELEALLMEQVEHNSHMRQNYQHIAAERNYYKSQLENLQRQLQSASQQPSSDQTADDARGRSQHSPNSVPSAPPYRRRSRLSQPIQPLKLPENVD